MQGLGHFLASVVEEERHTCSPWCIGDNCYALLKLTANGAAVVDADGILAVASGLRVCQQPNPACENEQEEIEDFS